MSKRRNDKSKMRRRRAKRKAKQQVGDRTYEFEHQNDKGYDVEMIRDFLEQLLLELRTVHFQYLEKAKLLNEHGDLAKVCDLASDTLSREVKEQINMFHGKYETNLLRKHSINLENATEFEINVVAEAFLEAQAQRRDEQIGHLEALEDLFDEALHCAKVPIGINSEGIEFGSIESLDVREMVDEAKRDTA